MYFELGVSNATSVTQKVHVVFEKPNRGSFTCSVRVTALGFTLTTGGLQGAGASGVHLAKSLMSDRGETPLGLPTATLNLGAMATGHNASEHMHGAGVRWCSTPIWT
jgi:hypothetical protein